jgi:Lipase (class 3)
MRKSPQLLFTGHSAGGAVASILYAHMLATSTSPSSLQSLSLKLSAIHLITFGAPPVTSPPIPSPSQLLACSPSELARGGIREKNALNLTAFYAIINEGDPIPRADEKYIDALLRVFVSLGPPKSSHLSKMPDSSVSSQLAGISLDGRGKQGPVYQLPEMELKNAGTQLLIRKRDSRSTARFWNVPEDGNEGSLQSMLFGNPRMHRMLTYLERLGIC